MLALAAVLVLVGLFYALPAWLLWVFGGWPCLFIFVCFVFVSLFIQTAMKDNQ